MDTKIVEESVRRTARVSLVNAEPITLRDRNQMTLPGDAVKSLDLRAGDLLVPDLETVPGAITLRPVDLVPRSGSLDAATTLEQADAAIDAGVHPRFRNVREFRRHLAGLTLNSADTD